MSKQVLRLEIDPDADTLSVEVHAGPISGTIGVTQISKTLAGLIVDPAAAFAVLRDLAAAGHAQVPPESRTQPRQWADFSRGANPHG